MPQTRTNPEQSGFGSFGFFCEAEIPTRPDRHIDVHIEPITSPKPSSMRGKSRKRREKTNKGRLRGKRTKAINEGVLRGGAGWQSPLPLQQNVRKRARELAMRKIDAVPMPTSIHRDDISPRTLADIAEAMVHQAIWDLRSGEDERALDAVTWLVRTDSPFPFRVACTLTGVDPRLLLSQLVPNLTAPASPKLCRLCGELGVGRYAKTIGDIVAEI